MRYRQARLLHNGDQVIRKTDDNPLTVNAIEVFGNVKIVKLYCIDQNNALINLFHDEVK